MKPEKIAPWVDNFLRGLSRRRTSGFAEVTSVYRLSPCKEFYDEMFSGCYQLYQGVESGRKGSASPMAEGG